MKWEDAGRALAGRPQGWGEKDAMMNAAKIF